MMQLYSDCTGSRVATTSSNDVLAKLGQHTRMHCNPKDTPREASDVITTEGSKIGATRATEARGVGAIESGLPTEVTKPPITEPNDAGVIEPRESAATECGLSANSNVTRVPQRASSTELSSTDGHVTSYKQHLPDKRLRQRSRTPCKDWLPSRERKPKYWCRCHPSGERCDWDTYGGCSHHLDLDKNRHKIMMEGYANANAYHWCSALSLQEKNAFFNIEPIELPDFDEDP